MQAGSLSRAPHCTAGRLWALLVSTAAAQCSCLATGALRPSSHTDTQRSKQASKDDVSVLTCHTLSAGPGASLVPCLRTATSHMQHTYDFFKPSELWPQAGNLVCSVQSDPCACTCACPVLVVAVYGTLFSCASRGGPVWPPLEQLAEYRPELQRSDSGSACTCT